MSTRERFEARITPVPECGCWLWLGAWHPQWGYGRLKVDGKDEGAHRVSFELHVGPIPEGMFVCHRCDTPPCVNPAHLFLGTHADNVADMVAKRRNVQFHAAGQDHPNARLTEPQVIAIFHDRRRTTDIARAYGVSLPTVCSIKSGQNWKHLHLLEDAA